MKKRILSLLLSLLMVMSIAPVNVIAEGAEDYSANVTGTAVFNPAWNTVSGEEIVYGTAYVTDDPTLGLNMSTDYTMSLEGVMDQTFYINNYYSDGTGYWYELAALAGETLPDKLSDMPWVYQNDIPGGAYPDYLIVTPPVVKPTDPTDPSEPEDSCSCCENCTGAEGCECECGACDFCGKEEPEIPVLTHPTGVEVTAESFPEGVSLTVQEVSVSSQLNKYQIPESKQVFGLDISLLNADSSIYQPGGALVKVPVSAPVGTKIGIIHDHNGNISFLGVTKVLSDGTVEFYTDSFSTFAGFTVDFHYNGVDFSIDGRTSILLSELFTAMGINENAYAAETVVFSDTSLVLPTRQDNGDWLLTSLEAFSTEETLIISFTDGHTIVIDVTDASKGVQTTNDQVHLSTSGTSKTYQIFGKLYPDVNGDYTSFATTLFGVEVDFVLYEGNAYPGSGNGSQVGTAWIDQAAFGVQFSLTGSYWYEVYDTYRCQVSEKGTDNFVFDSTNVLTGRKVYIRRYPRTTYYNDNYCKVTQASVMSDSKTTRTVYIYANGTQVGNWTGYFPDRTSAAASDLTVTPYGNWKGRGDVSSNATVVVSNGNYYVYLVSTHTVTWKNWDGSILETDTDVVYGATPSYGSAEPTRATAEGYSYSFSGWSPSVTKVTENTTYTAQFNPSPISYSVSFNGNGATGGSMSNQSFTFGTAQNLTANGYTRAYTVTYDAKGGTVNTTAANTTATATFNGWEDRGSIVYKGTTYSYTTFDAPYYVQPYREEPKSKDVFDSAGFGNGHYNKYGLLDHYVLHGAAEYNNGSVDRKPTPGEGEAPGLYPDQAKVSNLATTNGYTVPLYANWTLGSVTLPNPKKTGYAFKGWYTDAACSDGNEVKGTTYTPTSNVTLYAKWEANTYKVTLDARNNAGESDGTTAYWYMYNTTKDVNGETVYYWTDAACTQPLSGYTITKPVKKGHTFGGYYASTDFANATQYVDANGMCVNNLYAAVADNSTLYAKWNAKTFTINYHANGGSGSMDSHTVAYGSTVQIKGNGFTPPPGMQFAGWAVSATGTAGEYGWSETDKTGWAGTWNYDNGEHGISNNTLNLYAIWENASYTVTWKNWDGSTLDTDTVINGGSATYDKDQPTRPDAAGYSYTFNGWDKGSNGTVSNVTANTTVTAQYAQTPISYTATFDYNGGDSDIVSRSFTVESTLSLPALTRTGYRGVWKVTTAAGNWSDGTEYAPGSSITEQYGNVAFTAQWEVQYRYVLKFDANGGSGGPADQTQDWCGDTSCTFSWNQNSVPTREGYSFLGWAESSASQTNVAGSGYNGYRITGKQAETVEKTLFAIWKRDTGDLKLTFNGTETAPAIVTVTGQGKTITLVLTKSETVIKDLPTGTYKVTVESGNASYTASVKSNTDPRVEKDQTAVADIEISSKGLNWFTAFFRVKNECKNN